MLNILLWGSQRAALSFTVFLYISPLQTVLTSMFSSGHFGEKLLLSDGEGRIIQLFVGFFCASIWHYLWSIRIHFIGHHAFSKPPVFRQPSLAAILKDQVLKNFNSQSSFTATHFHAGPGSILHISRLASCVSTHSESPDVFQFSAFTILFFLA